MLGGHPKAGLTKSSTEGLAKANRFEEERRRRPRRPSLRLTILFVVIILAGWAAWEFLA